HAEVGEEEEDGKNPPGAAPERVNHQHGGKQREPLQPQHGFDGAGDLSRGLAMGRRGSFVHLSIPLLCGPLVRQKAAKGRFWFAERPCIAFSSEVTPVRARKTLKNKGLESPF